MGPCLTAGSGREDRHFALLRTASALGVAQLISVRFEEPTAGERYIVVSVVDAPTGQETREARVKIGGGGPPQGSIARLADFLATGEATEPVEPMIGAKKVAAAPAPAPSILRKEAPASSSGLKTGAYVSGGDGAAALLASGYLMFAAEGAQSRIARLCAGGSCINGSRAEVSHLEEQTGSQRSLGAVLAGVGAAALATGVVLYVLEPSRSEPSIVVTATLAGARVALSF